MVSGAAGATGSVVGQIAKIKGCRVIGIAGGPDKCAWIKDELGFDAAIDYRAEDVEKRLRELCPNGIDVYFDNVGGAILDAALANLAMRGRVVLCGAIGDYNSKEPPPGPRNYLSLLMKRGRMEGFIVLDYLPRGGRGDRGARGLGGGGQDQGSRGRRHGDRERARGAAATVHRGEHGQAAHQSRRLTILKARASRSRSRSRAAR